MSSKSILVLGAGELGTPILQSLAQHPSRGTAKLTVLLREQTINTKDAAKKKSVDHLRSLGIELLAGDVQQDDERTLAAKFQPFDTIIGCTGMAGVPNTQVKLARAVLAAGSVRKYIPWQFGVDYDVIGRASSQDLFTEQLLVRDLLRTQVQTKWVIISVGMFMSFLFEDFFGVVSADRRTVRALGSWETKVTVTCVEDIGRVTAEVIFGQPAIEDQVVFAAGDSISYGELADVVEKVGGQKVDREEWTVEKLKKDLASDAENGIKKYRVAFAEGTGVSWDLSKTINAQRGLQLLTVEQWLQREGKD